LFLFLKKKKKEASTESDEQSRQLWTQLEEHVSENLTIEIPWEAQHGAFGAAAIMYVNGSDKFKTEVFEAATYSSFSFSFLVFLSYYYF
jgi:hypothetical protein